MKKIKIYESRESEKIEKFIPADDLIDLIKELCIENLCTLYFDDKGDVIAQTIWNEVYKNPFK